MPKSELDGEMGDAHMAMQARLMSQALRKLCHSLSQSQTVLVFINQVFLILHFLFQHKLHIPSVMQSDFLHVICCNEDVV